MPCCEYLNVKLSEKPDRLSPWLSQNTADTILKFYRCEIQH